MGLVALLVARSVGDKVAVGVYTFGLTAMYTSSACYHRGHWAPAAKRRMRRLDHSMILVAIASTYTAVAVLGLSKTTAWVLLSVVWTLAVAGAVLHNVWFDAPRWTTAALYITVGWVAVAALPMMWASLGVAIFTLVIVAGLLYSTGAVLFSYGRPDPIPTVFGYHEVFHVFVIAAGLVFYVAVIALAARA
jgi:hemolysin III